MTTSASLPSLHKRAGNWVLNEYETALVEYNGEPIAITFTRGWTDAHGSGLKVRRLLTGEVLASVPWIGGLGCAIVVDGAIHVFGSTQWLVNNQIIHSVLDANFQPSVPHVAISAPSCTWFFNTAITQAVTGYVMAAETSKGVFFYSSPDLVSWSQIGGQLLPGQYCGCPSIEFIEGVFFITYLAKLDDGRFVTRVAKTVDLFHFDMFAGAAALPAYIALISPDGSEGLNASDVDMAEHNGQTLLVYMTGDQTTWAHLRTAVYFGPMKQLFSEFFP